MDLQISVTSCNPRHTFAAIKKYFKKIDTYSILSKI